MKKEVKTQKRKVGRPKKVGPTKDVVIAFRVSPDEAEKLKQLAEDTKADNFTAMMRNFISCGLLFLQKNAQPQNKVFYERFSRYWDLMKHLDDYSDDWGKAAKEKNKAVNK
jgi:hypothetical protein